MRGIISIAIKEFLCLILLLNLFFILGICVVIYIIGIVSRHRFKQKLAGYWGSSNRLAKADSEASLCESSARNGTSVIR